MQGCDPGTTAASRTSCGFRSHCLTRKQLQSFFRVSNAFTWPTIVPIYSQSNLMNIKSSHSIQMLWIIQFKSSPSKLNLFRSHINLINLIWLGVPDTSESSIMSGAAPRTKDTVVEEICVLQESSLDLRCLSHTTVQSVSISFSPTNPTSYQYVAGMFPKIFVQQKNIQKTPSRLTSSRVECKSLWQSLEKREPWHVGDRYTMVPGCQYILYVSCT